MDRNETIARIKTALKRRSGKTWSVTGGRGTAWGWIQIDAPPARQCYHHVLKDKNMSNLRAEMSDYVEVKGEPNGHTGPGDRAELAQLLGLERVHTQGVSIPASNDYYQEYIDRAEGRAPSRIGKPYWD